MIDGPFQWRVFRANLDPAVGSEQAGQRPVLVVSNEIMNEVLPIVTVLPLTSRKPGRPGRIHQRTPFPQSSWPTKSELSPSAGCRLCTDILQIRLCVRLFR